MSTFGYKQENLSGLPEDPNNAPAPSQQTQQMGFFTKTAIHIIGAVAGACKYAISFAISFVLFCN